MSPFGIIFIGLIGLGTCWGLIQLILKRSLWPATFARRVQFHQTHANPIPRIGGVALVAAFLAVAAAGFSRLQLGQQDRREFIAITCGSVGMFLLGFVDDVRPLSARLKFLAQILIAVLVCVGGLCVTELSNPITGTVYALGPFGYVVTVFWLVALTNVINLVDGLDGLAGGISFMVLCLLAYVAMRSNASLSVLLATGMGAALLGFLYFNFPPARIYMGDGGAYLLGFLIGCLAIAGNHKRDVFAALAAPTLALALPIFDVAVAMLRRGVRGLPIFRPDKKHIHHRLSNLGLTPTKTVLVLYGLSFVFLLLGFSVLWSGRLLPVALGIGAVFAVAGIRSIARVEDWLALRHALGSAGRIRRESRYALALGRCLEMEAERAPTVGQLWSCFEGCVQKLQFSSVCVHIGSQSREWRNPAAGGPPADLSDRHELGGDPEVAVEFTGSSQVMHPKVFFLISELTSEAWLKASRRWQSVHGPAVVFDPPAGAPAAAAIPASPAH
ncbi:MAG: undecaprenyl/decaprenyl-phosphate alpha-N-acetylglucosaminyl 1-phosphate transferase [Verrucomicrobia bacterium]|nr:undecaprenyl/decaprenyl-phosphate alpha-N-acetylglucosaminyl 1-phosphate transferase [Verrucomicrobiota bacterium]